MFAHGMCKECYLEFLKVTGGLHQPGANPPSFQANLEGEAARMVGHHPVVSQQVNPWEKGQRFWPCPWQTCPIGQSSDRGRHWAAETGARGASRIAGVFGRRR